MIEHLNLVRLYGYLEHGNEQMILVEYISNGTLREHLDGKSSNNYLYSEGIIVSRVKECISRSQVYMCAVCGKLNSSQLIPVELLSNSMNQKNSINQMRIRNERKFILRVWFFTKEPALSFNLIGWKIFVSCKIRIMRLSFGFTLNAKTPKHFQRQI